VQGGEDNDVVVQGLTPFRLLYLGRYHRFGENILSSSTRLKIKIICLF
jgi:hypothetical protein